MALLSRLGVLIVGLMLLAGDASAALSEHRVKAVFLFNFSKFVEWPPSAFAAADAPFVIGVFGRDPFGSDLDDVARGETVNGRPLLVRRVQTAQDAAACQILFIPQSERASLDDILAALARSNTLTVSDLDGAAQRGAMIRLITDHDKVRLRINVESARAAGLTISSKLLRSAEIVAAADGA
ncbi:MAG TPA: YfiR family protein [Steroidobacteraceae bacterium]|nr:YfiR family protein [Steroidobacteraceae bacterium]